MKISRLSWIFFIAGVLIIACAGLGLNYRNKVAEQAALQEQITATNKKISAINVVDLTNRETDLKVQIAKTDSQISTARENLIQPLNSINITDTLSKIASDNEVEVLDVSSQGIATQNMGKIPLDALSFTLKVRGDVSNINGFVHNVTAQFSTSIVKSVQIDVPPLPPPPPELAVSNTWSLDSGSLPGGLELNPSTGAITGTPAATGTSNFTVKASFSDDTSATQDLSITVDPHSIKTGALPNGELNVPYNQTLDASGDVPIVPDVPLDNNKPTATLTVSILSGKES